ncbi:uncharacterized protein BDW70DRAFT_130239 [Aspergillus foveolatus]|uniref:uncharacterized protein n=1 Tax=Aspergillus foveolatus TaxID=210207 RepID=UPI003CCCE89C
MELLEAFHHPIWTRSVPPPCAYPSQPKFSRSAHSLACSTSISPVKATMVTRRDPAVTTSAWALLYVTLLRDPWLIWYKLITRLLLGAEVPTTSLAYRYTSMSGTFGDPLKQDDGGKSQRCRFPSTPYGSAPPLAMRSLLHTDVGKYHNVNKTDGPGTSIVTPLRRSS